ncbi:uncharacterized protein N7515_002987 [Penicillium bovifimosum]|uniref:C2H2-type domain-containing protein n=1 Tax=Penicillium bovifimosum TaxID=126998 RepID=A0A9W9HCI5_9EURO|nr:uncharacterized protein N7515_002987 [Penicillium bovifimosum]KAJ5144200.1 hypothetical protein N7515_002987 [Penicillium bovifimosum]
MSPSPRRRKKLSLECSVCKRCYAKREHLQRHELIHTGAKPFACAICDRSFSRQDVLNRHARVHQNLPAAQGERQNQQGSALPMQQLEPDPTPFPSQGPNGTSLEDCSALLWPDSEDLLQSILSMGTGQWELGAQVMPQALAVPLYPTSYPSGISPSDQSTIVEDGERAIHSLSGLISETFCSVTTPTALTGLNSRFLDSSLHMFFKNVVPMFPVIHQPTFVFRDCPAPLLLNAIALGALFLGTPDATIKDRTLRVTSQVFHGLAIYWASHCGMYEMIDQAPLPAADDSPDIISDAWSIWIARETRLRTLLGLYIVDGVVSQFSGNPTFARHMANPLALPSNEKAFQALSAGEWIGIMHQNAVSSGSNIRFCDVFRSLFSTDERASTLTPRCGISLFHHKVILEGIRSLVADANRTDPPPVGVPTKAEISQTMNRLRAHIVGEEILSPTEQLVALLQWHTIALDLVVSTARGTRRMCYMHGISQRIFGGDSRDETDIDPRRWAQSKSARIALLHASQIQDLATRLPLGMAYDVNVPGAVFAAATTYSAFALAGAGKVVLPSMVDWEAVIHSTAADPPSSGGSSTQETLAFIDGTFYVRGLLRDLSYELTSIRSLLRGLSLHWGVAQEMEEVVNAWIERCA